MTLPGMGAPAGISWVQTTGPGGGGDNAGKFYYWTPYIEGVPFG